eukprot:365682-Chlamydomonas_euryale.AAC.23
MRLVPTLLAAHAGRGKTYERLECVSPTGRDASSRALWRSWPGTAVGVLPSKVLAEHVHGTLCIVGLLASDIRKRGYHGRGPLSQAQDQ